MRYDLKLFQFILNLMEIMFLAQESMKCLAGWSKLTQELVVAVKKIGVGSSMLVKHFRSRVIVGHWYPIVSIDCYEHSIIGMMVLGYGYSLVFGPFDVRKPCRGMDCPRWGCQRNLEGV